MVAHNIKAISELYDSNNLLEYLRGKVSDDLMSTNQWRNFEIHTMCGKSIAGAPSEYWPSTRACSLCSKTGKVNKSFVVWMNNELEQDRVLFAKWRHKRLHIASHLHQQEENLFQ